MTRSTRLVHLPRRPLRPATAVRALVPALALTAALATTACDPVQSGAAVVIDGDRVPVSEVQNKVSQVTEQRERNGQQAQPVSAVTQEQVRRIILSRILERAAAEAGVTVTQADIDNQRRELEQRAGGPDAFAKQAAEANVVPGELNEFLRSLILEQKIGEALVPTVTSEQEQQQRSAKLNELVTRVTRGLDIKVNPRYGTWNQESFAIEPGLGGYVKPERDLPTATAPPGQ